MLGTATTSTVGLCELQRKRHHLSREIKMGIKIISSAFDPIERSFLLELLAGSGCSEDDIRLVRYLLMYQI